MIHYLFILFDLIINRKEKEKNYFESSTFFFCFEKTIMIIVIIIHKTVSEFCKFIIFIFISQTKKICVVFVISSIPVIISNYLF